MDLFTAQVDPYMMACEEAAEQDNTLLPQYDVKNLIDSLDICTFQ